MKQVIQIRCKNNKKTQNVAIGSTLSDVFSEFKIDMPYGPICARVNNKVEGMHFRVYHSKDVEFLDMHSASASRNYTRTLFFVLCKAVHDIYPKSRVVIDIPVSNGYYVNLQLGHPVGLEDVEKIRERMKKIIHARMPVTRHEVPSEQAIKMFRDRGDGAKVKLLESSGRLYTTYYQIDDYVDFYYGSLLTNTKKLYLFGLEKYYDGLLLRIPSMKDPSVLPEMTRQDKMFEIFKEHHRWQDIMGVRTVGDFNESVTNGFATGLINVSEALQEKKIAMGHKPDDHEEAPRQDMGGMTMGADPIASARALKGAIFHIHGKDARIERGLADINGLLETKPVTDCENRTWNYVAVGCGKDLQWWKEFFSVCHMMGYDGDVSLEMEDLTMTVDAGVNTSIDALRQTISQ